MEVRQARDLQEAIQRDGVEDRVTVSHEDGSIEVITSPESFRGQTRFEGQGRGVPLNERAEVSGRTVLVRSDLNVPLDGSTITDDGRVRASVPTIRKLVDAGARVVVVAHLGRPKGAPDPKYSMDPVRQRLAELAPGVELLENLRPLFKNGRWMWFAYCDPDDVVVGAAVIDGSDVDEVSGTVVVSSTSEYARTSH